MRKLVYGAAGFGLLALSVALAQSRGRRRAAMSRTRHRSLIAGATSCIMWPCVFNATPRAMSAES